MFSYNLNIYAATVLMYRRAAMFHIYSQQLESSANHLPGGIDPRAAPFMSEFSFFALLPVCSWAWPILAGAWAPETPTGDAPSAPVRTLTMGQQQMRTPAPNEHPFGLVHVSWHGEHIFFSFFLCPFPFLFCFYILVLKIIFIITKVLQFLFFLTNSRKFSRISKVVQFF